MSIHSSFRLPCLALAVASLAACSSSNGDASSSAPTEPLHASASYDLRSDVARLDAAVWDAAVMPNDGPELWVSPSVKDADWLKPGAITVFSGRGVLKVGSVQDAGDHLVVTTQPVGYGDFIENGTLSMSGATSFDSSFDDGDGDLGVKDMAGDVKPQGLGKILNDTAKKLLTDGWVLQKSVSGDGDALHYDITMTKDTGGLLAKLHVTGTMNNLATAFDVAVQNHTTSRQTFDVHTSGEADLTWEVGISEGSVGYNKILLPGVAFKKPFLVGEVPMLLQVKSSFALIVGATGKNTTTTGKVHVTYSSDGGVHVSGTSGDSNAQGSGEATYADDQGTLAVGPSAFGFVATLPKVEVGVGIDKLFVAGTYFSNTSNTVVKAIGAIGGSPCADVDTKLTGNVGLFLDAGLGGTLIQKGLDLTEDKLSKKLYEVEHTSQTCGLK